MRGRGRALNDGRIQSARGRACAGGRIRLFVFSRNCDKKLALRFAFGARNFLTRFLGRRRFLSPRYNRRDRSGFWRFARLCLRLPKKLDNKNRLPALIYSFCGRDANLGKFPAQNICAMSRRIHPRRMDVPRIAKIDREIFSRIAITVSRFSKPLPRCRALGARMREIPFFGHVLGLPACGLRKNWTPLKRPKGKSSTVVIRKVRENRRNNCRIKIRLCSEVRIEKRARKKEDGDSAENENRFPAKRVGTKIISLVWDEKIVEMFFHTVPVLYHETRQNSIPAF